MPDNSPDTPNAVRKALRLDDVSTPPALPQAWTATALMTPYGQYQPAMGAAYSQLAVAQITYSAFGTGQVMWVDMYLPESGKFFAWFFSTQGTQSKWYWLKAAPGGGDQGAIGPFPTTAAVPDADFLSRAKAGYSGYWPLFNQPTRHYLALTSQADMGGGQMQKYGSWYAFNSAGNLSRVLNIPADNAMKLPVLGAYFMSNIVNFRAIGDTSELQARAKAVLDPAGAEAGPDAFANPMLTQVDLGNAMANPLWSAPCTLAQVQAVLPGYAPLPAWPLPEWSPTVKITGWTLGMNVLPFYTEVYYSDPMQRQRSEFVGWGPDVTESYNYRQDTVLYSNYFNDVQYQYTNGQWQKLSCSKGPPGVGYPRPNFPARMGAVVKGTISGNPQFGLKAGQSLYMTLAEMPRSVPGQPSYVSAFWDWWREDQSGVIFTEAEVSTPPQHALSVIDYVTFQRNAPVGPNDFDDPCQSVPHEAPATKQGKAARRRIPPGHRST